MKYILLYLLLICPVYAGEDTATWQVRDTHSFIKFSVAIEGSPAEGEFTGFSADIEFDPETLDQARVDVRIDLNHIEAFYDDVADGLKKEAWFNVAQYPTARFAGADFIHLGDNQYQVTGNLSLKGITRPETLYFTLARYGPHRAVIKGRMTINRLDYGVGQGPWRSLSTVAGQVFLDVVIDATRKP